MSIVTGGLKLALTTFIAREQCGTLFTRAQFIRRPPERCGEGEYKEQLRGCSRTLRVETYKCWWTWAGVRSSLVKVVLLYGGRRVLVLNFLLRRIVLLAAVLLPSDNSRLVYPDPAYLVLSQLVPHVPRTEVFSHQQHQNPLQRIYHTSSVTSTTCLESHSVSQITNILSFAIPEACVGQYQVPQRDSVNSRWIKVVTR